MKKPLLVAAGIMILVGSCYSLHVMNTNADKRMIEIIQKPTLSEDEEYAVTRWYNSADDGVPSQKFIELYQKRYGK